MKKMFVAFAVLTALVVAGCSATVAVDPTGGNNVTYAVKK